MGSRMGADGESYDLAISPVRAAAKPVRLRLADADRRTSWGKSRRQPDHRHAGIEGHPLAIIPSRSGASARLSRSASSASHNAAKFSARLTRQTDLTYSGAVIPLEDNFNDILGKAQRGLKLTDDQLAQGGGNFSRRRRQAAGGGPIRRIANFPKTLRRSDWGTDAPRGHRQQGLQPAAQYVDRVGIVQHAV